MNDSELVQALQAGDREAFSLLMDRYRGLVQGLCYRLAGNRHDADELAHEAFVEAYLKIGTLRDPAALPGWLRTLTLNLCRMWFRRNQHRWTELPDDVPADQPIEEKDDPSLLARMAGGLSLLPAPQRLVLVLHYFEGLSYDQMAEFLDVPAGTVMSRLFRARKALRQILECPVLDEEIPMVEDDRFKQEVQAEIALLLEMFSQEPSVAQRLRVILQHSPQRLIDLIQRTNSEETLGNLAILLPRLGPTAMDATLTAAFSADPSTASHADTVLRGVISRSRAVTEPGWEPATPEPGVYGLVDRLIEQPAEASAKAELLLDLLDACEDDSIAAMITNMLLCYPMDSSALLIEWFRALPTPRDLYDAGWRLFAICRIGTPFCKILAEDLHSEDLHRQIVALAGAEALGRCVDLRWLQEAAPEELARAVRCRAKWPPLRREDLDPAALARMLDRIADLLDHPQSEVRNMALGALGRLRSAGHLKRILPLAVHEDESTRLAAIRALAEIGHPAAGGVLMHVARAPDSASVHRAAIDALGRMKVQEAADLLVEQLADPAPQIQEAAVAALAEIGTPAAHAALQQTLTSGSTRLRKIVARVVFSKQHQQKRTAGSSPVQTQAQRLRGNARPVAYSSISEVLRRALPQTQIGRHEEQDLTRRIAAVCCDYSLTRRRLVDEGWMTREAGLYELTEAGQAAWRVEQFIMQHYLK